MLTYLICICSGVRPFGVSLLICGWDNGRPYLYQSDPSGAYFAWKATAMGKNAVNGKTFLEKRLVALKFYSKYTSITNDVFHLQLQRRSRAGRCCPHRYPDSERRLRGKNDCRQHWDRNLRSERIPASGPRLNQGLPGQHPLNVKRPAKINPS